MREGFVIVVDARRALSFAGYRTAAIYHACVSSLEAVDRVLAAFLDELGIATLCAFTGFCLARLSARRDIAMLGMIHRTVLGQCPAQFKRLLFREDVTDRRSARFHRHHHQIHEWNTGRQLEIASRSALGWASVCNIVPQEAVDSRSVKLFQGFVQGFVRYLAERGGHRWGHCIATRRPMHARPLLHI